MLELTHRKEFEDILKTYQVGPRARAALEEINFVIMVAPSSTGRNRIMSELMKTGDYHEVVTDTTRPPRINDGIPERDGVEYNFKTEEEFLKGLHEGNYVEAAIIHNQQVSGIHISELEKAAGFDKIAIADIETVGADTIHRAKPTVKAVFLLPPSFEEWMRRLERRGVMTQEEKQKRLHSAVKEFEAALQHEYFTFIINDDLETCVKEVNEFAHDFKTPDQTQVKETAEELLRATKRQLTR